MIRALIFTMAFVALGAPAFADGPATKYEQHAAAGVDLPVPDGWDRHADGDTLVLVSPDERITVMFLALEQDDLEAALEAIDEVLASEFSELQATSEPEESEIGGMPAILVEADAKLSGQPAALGIAVVMTPKQKVLLVVGVAVDGGLEGAHAAELGAILTGLRPSE